MNEEEAARDQWWEGLSDSERNIWSARARGAGVSTWELKKASIFDKGVTFAELSRQLGQQGALPMDGDATERKAGELDALR